MDTIRVDGKARIKTGKGASRKLRRTGRLPAVFYGPEAESIMISIDYLELVKSLKGRPPENVIFDLKIDSNGGSQSKKVMIKELQRDPVTRDYLHIDFCEISMAREIETNIPIQLVNTPIGVTKGGLVEHIRRELSVVCLPKDLVDEIEIDVSGLDIGETLHIADIALPSGLRATEDGDLIVATVVAPTITAEEEEAEEEEVEAEEALEKTESEETGGNKE
ncbi:MAG: 50S ribosomal protein L25 [Deltaproteobacteria bacterium]|nr:50S ribosomal protein L25 [Deltaproteobacteria bacterium]